VEYFLCVLGMVFIIEGVPYFAFPEIIKKYLLKIIEMPASALRVMGFTAIAVGLLLVYMGRH